MRKTNKKAVAPFADVSSCRDVLLSSTLHPPLVPPSPPEQPNRQMPGRPPQPAALITTTRAAEPEGAHSFTRHGTFSAGPRRTVCQTAYCVHRRLVRYCGVGNRRSDEPYILETERVTLKRQDTDITSAAVFRTGPDSAHVSGIRPAPKLMQQCIYACKTTGCRCPTIACRGKYLAGRIIRATSLSRCSSWTAPCKSVEPVPPVAESGAAQHSSSSPFP